MVKSLYIERALFVVGEPNDGKSTQLRSLFCDRRFGGNGKIPISKKIPETYVLSHERSLYLRLTSPHEYNESPDDLFEKIREKAISGRWAIASPLQPEARNKMPDVVETVRLFIETFSPERIRVCFLSPNQAGNVSDNRSRQQSLWKLKNVECLTLDARTRAGNGFIYADFFDYT